MHSPYLHCSKSAIQAQRAHLARIPRQHSQRSLSLVSSAPHGHFATRTPSHLVPIPKHHQHLPAGAFPLSVRPITTESVINANTEHPGAAQPKPVKGWPTPILTQAELESYLVPLFARDSWSVEYRMSGTDRKTVTPVLKKVLEVQSRYGLEVIQGLVKTLEASEKHHAELTLERRGIQSRTMQELLDLSNIPQDAAPFWITIYVHTHSAVYPGPEGSESNGEVAPKHYAPGLTIRDVRFALLLDQAIDKRNAQ